LLPWRENRPSWRGTDRATSARCDLFNAVYELLLQMIASYFAFAHRTPEQRQVLAHGLSA
jgi:hypothetical protein